MLLLEQTAVWKVSMVREFPFDYGFKGKLKRNKIADYGNIFKYIF